MIGLSMIDLRSDTVTRPTDEMRAALCNWALYVDEITLPSRPKAVSVRATPLIGADAEGPRATFAERLARLVK